MKRFNTSIALLILFSLSLLGAVTIILTRGKADGKSISIKNGKSSESIAVVKIYGPIRISASGKMFQFVNVDDTVRYLTKLRERKDVKAVILRINSPGGSVGAVQELYLAVKKLKASGKVVVASLGDVAASGGYYIASIADKIVANPGTLTGSIGVLLELGDVQELFKKFGVKIETIKSGRMKDAGSPFKQLSKEERRLFQGVVNDTYRQFLNDVAEGRKMKKSKLRPLADGRIFSGAQAMKNGLVDELGNMETAVEITKKLAKITAEKPNIIYRHKPWGNILKLLEQTASFKLLPESLTDEKIRLEYMME